MTVKELIDSLKRMPQDLPVLCWQPGTYAKPSSVFVHKFAHVLIETNEVETPR